MLVNSLVNMPIFPKWKSKSSKVQLRNRLNIPFSAQFPGSFNGFVTNYTRDLTTGLPFSSNARYAAGVKWSCVNKTSHCSGIAR